MRSQSPKVEMIDALFKPMDDGNDDGIIRFDYFVHLELLLFCTTFVLLIIQQDEQIETHLATK